MPSDARERFAQQLGQVMDAHRNGEDPVAAVSGEDAHEANGAEVQEHEESEAENPQEQAEKDTEAEQLRSDLQPKDGDSPEEARDKASMLRRLERAERRMAKARKEASVDPTLAQKAAAYEMLMANPDLAAAVSKTKGVRADTGTPDFDGELAQIREWYVKDDPANQESFEQLTRLIRAVAGKDTMPLYQAVHGLAGRTIDGDWAKLEEKYGSDIADWKDATFATAKRLQIPLHKALLLESDGEIKAMERNMSDRQKQKKSITTPTQGGASGAYSRPKPKLGGSTREDRLKNFTQGARKQGLDLPWLRFSGLTGGR